MASRISALQTERNDKMKEVAHLMAENTGSWKDKPHLTKQYDALLAHVTDLDEQIKREQQVLQANADRTFSDLGGREFDLGNPGSRDVENVASLVDGRGRKISMEQKLFREFCRNGIEGVQRQMTAADFQKFQATMSTTTPGQGGYTVPSVIAAQLIDFMKAYGAMRKVSDVFSTADGRPLNYPTSDGTAETGEIIAQNTTATGQDISFNTVPLNVYKFSSRIVAVPFELLQDAIIDIEALVNKRLAQRLGRAGNTYFTTGTGTNQPFGIVTQAGVGATGASGNTLTSPYVSIIDLIHSIDPAYRTPSCCFMGSDAAVKALRKLVDGNGRPLWMPNWDTALMQGVGIEGGSTGNSVGNGAGSVQVFDTLLGYPLYVNNDMAVPAANAKSLAFGDFSFFKIRDSMETQLFRFTDSAYTQLGQVGFLAWARMGSNLMDTNAVKLYQNSAT